ncbi:MAG: chemotaxis response regulator protein-glutamate methylesterase [Pseudomonadota bacterium]
MMKPVRVLVVDDSPVMRRLLTSVLEADGSIEVVGVAGDAYEARDAIKTLSPEVVTLDIEMPRMNGIAFLEKIMQLRPMPVVMVSSHTRKGADAAIEAMVKGAFDCVGKPTGLGGSKAFEELPRIVRHAAKAKMRKRVAAPETPVKSTAPAAPSGFTPGDRIFLLGASTGGVDALMDLVKELPSNCPPTLITQHMPASFSKSFAAHLNEVSPAQVRMATEGAPLSKGVVYVAPGGDAHLTVDTRGRGACKLEPGPKVNGHAPSVDRLFESATPFAKRVSAAILTGIGCDGAAGLLSLREGGAATIGQDQASSVVYGMPKAAKKLGAVGRELPLAKIAPTLLFTCKTGALV